MANKHSNNDKNSDNKDTIVILSWIYINKQSPSGLCNFGTI